MTEEKHNGFANYETWSVALWMDNDRGSQEYWREQSRESLQKAVTDPGVVDGTWTLDEAARLLLAEQIKTHITDGDPIQQPSVYSDLLNAAIADVDWYEIAGNCLAGLREDEAPVSDRPVIAADTRAEAITDGVLMDVSEMAKEVGINYPTAVTAGVWEKYVRVPAGVHGQDEKGRLWDILNMFYVAARRGLKSDTTLFDVLVRHDDTAPRPVALKAIYGRADSQDPVITIMLPYED